MQPINYKTHIKETKSGAIVVACDCGVDYTHDVKKFKSKKMDDMGNFENLATECPDCGQTTFFNMSLPPSEFDEQEIFEEPHFPPGEKEAREQVRALMWQVRDDLKGKDRAAFEKAKRSEVEGKYGLPLEAIRQNARRVAGNMGNPNL